MWYNTELAKYRVLYEDSSENYITLDDIIGIVMIFINISLLNLENFVPTFFVFLLFSSSHK